MRMCLHTHEHTHMNLIFIDIDDGMAPVRHQAIIRTNAGLL